MGQQRLLQAARVSAAPAAEGSPGPAGGSAASNIQQTLIKKAVT